MTTKTLAGTARETVDMTNHLELLRAQIDGELIEPGTGSYEEARAVWNGMIDRRPGVIARVRSESDVQAVVRFAAQHQLLLAVRGGGHNVAGTATAEGGMVLDLSGMNEVSVDPERRHVYVGGGATWADVDAATQVHGLAVPGGVVSDTGVGGLTLGGGVGWLRRKHGMTIDSLVGARIVTADGQVHEVDERNYPELLWGLKGGGGNFGVVTRFEFEAHPAGPEVPVAFVFYRASDAGPILRKVADLAPGLAREVAPLLFLGTIPEGHEFEETAWGEHFLALLAPAIVDDMERGWSIIEPLRELAEPIADFSEVMAYVDLQASLDEEYPAGELRYFWKSINVGELTDDVIDILVRFDRSRPSPLSTIDIWIHGGAMADVDPSATAFGDRSERYLMGIESNWENAGDDAANIGWARELVEALKSASSGKEYLNFPGFLEKGKSTLETAYGANYERLAKLKRRLDPDNLFRLHLNIEPAD